MSQRTLSKNISRISGEIHNERLLMLSCEETPYELQVSATILSVLTVQHVTDDISYLAISHPGLVQATVLFPPRSVHYRRTSSVSNFVPPSPCWLHAANIAESFFNALKTSFKMKLLLLML